MAMPCLLRLTILWHLSKATRLLLVTCVHFNYKWITNLVVDFQISFNAIEDLLLWVDPNLWLSILSKLCPIILGTCETSTETCNTSTKTCILFFSRFFFLHAWLFPLAIWLSICHGEPDGAPKCQFICITSRNKVRFDILQHHAFSRFYKS
jgi:hypothetical protein